MEKLKLCVLFITYNHVRYVKEALESMLMQKTTFSYKIVIGDDCSKDGTREIIMEYAAKYPDKIILSNPPSNLGAEKNFNQILARCIETDAEYMAYLEGDDYWMDEYRLQKQVDILEKDKEVGLVYGKYKILNNKGQFVDYKIPAYRSGFVFEDILLCKYLPSMHSSCFRTGLIREIFAQENFIGVDFYIIAEIARRKKLYYMNEYVFVYRQTAGSVTKIKAGDVTNHFTQALEIYRSEYPQLVKRGLAHGGRILSYNQMEDDPSFKNLVELFKKYEFSLLHHRQIIKWFYLRMRNSMA